MYPHFRTVFGQEFLKLLKEADKAVYDSIVRLIKEKDSTVTPSQVNDSIVTLVTPYVEQLFVGTASLEVCLFIWDQCLMVGFNRLMPEICTAFLVLLKDEILLCQSLAGLESTIQNQVRKSYQFNGTLF